MLDKLEAEIKRSLLAGERERAETLKMLKSAVLLEQKMNPGFSDTDFYAVVRKQIKMRTDAIALYDTNSQDKIDKEQSEVAILEEFLPAQLSEAELKAKIDQIAEQSGTSFEKQNMGKLIGLVSAEVGDSASKSDIAKIINSKIS